MKRRWVAASLLCCARLAHANPVILGDEDFARARLGALVILGLEALLATGLLARKGLRFWRALPVVMALNCATYLPLSRYLVHYGVYEIRFEDNSLWAEALIVAAEAAGFWLIGRVAALRKEGRDPIALGTAILTSLAVNIASVAVSIGWWMVVEEMYTP